MSAPRLIPARAARRLIAALLGRRFVRALGAPLLAAALLAPAAPAGASATQEAILQDDPQLLGASRATLDRRLAFLKAIGVDRVRVSVFWSNIAPAKRSQRAPRFRAPGAAYPDAYPHGAWDPYDDIAELAKRNNLDLLFTLTGPAPAWATPGRQRREGLYRPSPRHFRDFVAAVGRRYSGRHLVGSRNRRRLPRVGGWSIWNEPNFPSWLLPIWLPNRPKRARDMVAAAPHHYRLLLDAGWAGLARTGHARDLVLIGETAPRGGKKPTDLGNSMPPAEFVRELYCLRADFKPYRGQDARERGCPVDGSERAAFGRRHPGLFRSSGYAHHAYSLDRRTWRDPTWRHPLLDNVPIGNLGRLIRTLDRAQFAWGSQREPWDVWLTEYGYQTTPPDPIAGVAPERQGPLTAWGEYLAYRNPRVASIAQFLYVDDKPRRGFAQLDRRRWQTWQSGLFYTGERPKPFAIDYMLPMHVVQSGATLRVFGGYRPAPRGAEIPARVEHSLGDGRWRSLRELTVRNRRGYLNVVAAYPGAGFVRITWRDPRSGRAVSSRPARLR